MPVPEDDIVCRFVRSKDWSDSEQRPKPGAFKDPNLSVWHPARLEACAVRLEELQFGSLARTGQAHYAVGDFGRTVRKVESEAEQSGEPGSLAVAVEWAPDTVLEAWKRWVCAHIEVRTETDCKALWARFRRALCTSARQVIPPAPAADAESLSR